ncbi:MAG: hypothetical protein AAF698_02030 [Pseudomonadota bacterium]
MALQNRVLPTGEIVAAPWRGSLMGNRGCLHREDRSLGTARWRHKAWVTCVLSFRGRHRLAMPPPGSPTIYTALFFWDEASAFAAGHRPCGECRHADWQRFKAAWAAAGLPGDRAGAIDGVLHAARTDRQRRQITHDAEMGTLPDGVVLLDQGRPVLLAERRLWPWQAEGGYGPARPCGTGRVQVLTPKPAVAVLAAGYRPACRLPS